MFLFVNHFDGIAMPWRGIYEPLDAFTREGDEALVRGRAATWRDVFECILLRPHPLTSEFPGKLDLNNGRLEALPSPPVTTGAR